MLLVAVAVVASAAFGVVSERRTGWAVGAARGALGVMLYVFVPFISFVSFARLHLSAGGGAGIVLAYAALLITGVLAWSVGRRYLRLPRPALGALILAAVLVNTGYLGLPLAFATLGSRQLTSAVAYDQLVSAPMFLIVGFAIGAVFGTSAGASAGERLRAFLVRNPPLLAVVAGLLTPASAIPNSLVSASHVVVAALLPLGFFAVGVNLSAERREEAAPFLERPDRRVRTAVALRLLSAPVMLAAISLTVLHLPGAYLLQAAMPTGINSLMIGHAYGLDQRLIATAIVWSTIVVLAAGLVIVAL